MVAAFLLMAPILVLCVTCQVSFDMLGKIGTLIISIHKSVIEGALLGRGWL